MAKQMAFSSAELRKVDQVQFSVFSPDEIRKMSVAEITTTKTYEGGRPIYGGLLDPRFGTIDKQLVCETCDGDQDECPGHWGHLELARPVHHVAYINLVMRILRCVCFHCSKLRASEKDPAFKAAQRITHPARRLRAVQIASANKFRCGGTEEEIDQNVALFDNSDDILKKGFTSGCGGVQPKISRSGMIINAEFRESDIAQLQAEDEEEGNEQRNVERKMAVSPEQCIDILKRISDEDCIKLGLNPKFSRPEWFLLSVLPIAPLAVRPSITMEVGMRAEDDLTHQLAMIVRYNMELKREKEAGADPNVIDEITRFLQFSIAAYSDNDNPNKLGSLKAAQRSGRPIKSIRDRVRAKHGRVRWNLMGKRVDFSARSVITGDPNISVDQVGVPIELALHLTKPQVVTDMNREWLYKLVQNGPEIHPGALYIVRDDGTRINLARSQRRVDMHLKNGYIVERHIQDNDMIVFNRQPSLHKMSIMGHRVKVMPHNTFRLNLSVTSPYNADFDGDEMNMHVPQSVEADSEVMNLMIVTKQIVSPQGNRPVIGVVQDTLLGASKLTKRGAFLTREQIMSLLMWVDGEMSNIPAPAILAPVPLWTGKQVFSLFLPRVSFSRFSSGHPGTDSDPMCPLDTKVEIVDGKLLTGILDKSTLGTSHGSLIHVIWLELGHKAAMKFLNQVQAIVNNWLLFHGFSIGIQDCIADDSTMSDIETTIKKAKERVEHHVQAMRNGELVIEPGQTLFEAFEANVNRELNQAINDAGKSAQKSLDASNNIIAMVNAGSKGSPINISQIIACVGQQNVEGKRIRPAFTKRTLPHFWVDDLGPESKGFVENSYYLGLTPSEFFFHAMGGRVGLIDTACKTSETGYTQRRLMKATEDVMAKYDGTVRNSMGMVLQFLYGEDGMDACYLENQKFQDLNQSDRVFEARVKHSESVDETVYEAVTPEAREMMKKQKLSPAYSQVLDAEYAALVDDRRQLRTLFADGEDRWPVAVNLDRCIAAAKNLARQEQKAKVAGSEDQAAASPMMGHLAQTPGVTPTPQIGTMTPQIAMEDAGTESLFTSALRVVNPAEVVARTTDLISKLSVIPQSKLSMYKGVDPKFGALVESVGYAGQQAAISLFSVLLRSRLASKRVCGDYKLDSTSFKFLVETILDRFNKARVNPGEMVGAIASQSIGEPATQMTLNTFHFAGVSSKDVTLGVPRLKELINVAQNIKTPGCEVAIVEPLCYDDKIAKEMQTKIELATLKNVIHAAEIHYDPDDQNTRIEEDVDFVSGYYEIPDADQPPPELLSPWLLRLELDRDLMRGRKIKVSEIHACLMEHFKDLLLCMHSDENDEKLVVRIRQIEDEPQKGEEVVDEEVVFAPEEHSLHALFLDLLNNLTIRGIPRIKKVYIGERDRHYFSPETGKLERRTEFFLDTEGSALLEAMNSENVDGARTTTNDLVELFHFLGVEAARRLILEEIRRVLGFYGLYVNYRHLALLSDVMTYRGFLMPITRHGINRVETGPIIRSTFEETFEILTEASSFAELDPCTGISDNLMFGNTVPIGTNSFDILLDVEKVKDAKVRSMTYQMASAGLDDADLAQAVSASPDLLYPASPQDGGELGFTPHMMTPSVTMSPNFSPVLEPKSPYTAAGGGAGFSPALNAFTPRSPFATPRSPFQAGAGFSPSVAQTTPTFSPAAGYSGMSPASPYLTTPAWGGAGVHSPMPAAAPQSTAYRPVGADGGGAAGGAGYSPRAPQSPGGAMSPASFALSPSYTPHSPMVGGSPRPPAGPGGAGAEPGPPSLGSDHYTPMSASYTPEGLGEVESPAVLSPGQYSPTSPDNYSPTVNKDPETYSP